MKKLEEITEKTLQEPITIQEPIAEQSEMAQVLNNLDSNDKLGHNARLTDIQIKNIVIMDEFISLGLFSKDKASLTAGIKVLSISKDGKGREEKVAISSATQSAKLGKEGQGFFSKLLRPRE